MVPDQRSKADLERLPIEATRVSAGVRNSIVYSQLILTMFLWGLAWPVGRLLAEGLPAVSIAVLRYAIVVPVLFGILRFRGQAFALERRRIPHLVIMGLLSTTLYQAFFLYGVTYAAASDDSLVIGIGPVLVAILASFLLKERLSLTKGLGFISGLAGIAVISLLSPNTNVPNRLLGITLVFGGAVAYALYTVLLRRFVSDNRTVENRPAPSSLLILAWISLFGWTFLIPFSLLEAPWAYSWSFGSWLGILYLALLSTVVGYFLYIEGVSKIGAGRAAIFGNLVPVFGVITSALLLGEHLSPWHGVSFLLILSGVVLVNRQELMRQTKKS
ncbi:MAG TPA: DMT family transporter [Candidatus Dormibacteraeota bacterium]|jgi:drug/metabolite transporter (DMT)-like permease|nr:DMT family transporter [Candidatus Dormibacteraeota bacterium]